MKRCFSHPTSTPAATVATTLLVSSPMLEQRRHFRMFDRPPRDTRRGHTHKSLPMDHGSYWGGRSAFFRETRRGRYRGPEWKKFIPTLQYNIDIWCAQQTLRKKWKSRDWDVYELPFEKAPKELQRVIPELYTELPMMTDPENGDYSNLREKVFNIEDLQSVLFRGGNVYPPLVKVDKSKQTLDKFFSM